MTNQHEEDTLHHFRENKCKRESILAIANFFWFNRNGNNGISLWVYFKNACVDWSTFYIKSKFKYGYHYLVFYDIKGLSAFDFE